MCLYKYDLCRYFESLFKASNQFQTCDAICRFITSSTHTMSVDIMVKWDKYCFLSLFVGYQVVLNVFMDDWVGPLNDFLTFTKPLSQLIKKNKGNFFIRDALKSNHQDKTQEQCYFQNKSKVGTSTLGVCAEQLHHYSITVWLVLAH